MSNLEKGAYVLATRFSDGDPSDPFCVGFFSHVTPSNMRYHVADADGAFFRSNGFNRCEKINTEIGRLIVAASPIIGDMPGKSLWYWRYHPKQLAELIDPADKTG